MFIQDHKIMDNMKLYVCIYRVFRMPSQSNTWNSIFSKEQENILPDWLINRVIEWCKIDLITHTHIHTQITVTYFDALKNTWIEQSHKSDYVHMCMCTLVHNKINLKRSVESGIRLSQTIQSNKLTSWSSNGLMWSQMNKLK